MQQQPAEHRTAEGRCSFVIRSSSIVTLRLQRTYTRQAAGKIQATKKEVDPAVLRRSESGDGTAASFTAAGDGGAHLVATRDPTLSRLRLIVSLGRQMSVDQRLRVTAKSNRLRVATKGDRLRVATKSDRLRVTASFASAGHGGLRVHSLARELLPLNDCGQSPQPNRTADVPLRGRITRRILNRRIPAARAHNPSKSIPFLCGCICLSFMIRTSLFVNLRFVPVPVFEHLVFCCCCWRVRY
jgi:hypothetical protein